MRIVRTVAEMRAARPDDASVGLVPTMGALHAGHVSLFEAARAENDSRRREPVREPHAVRAERGLRRVPARRGARRAASPRTPASTSSSRRARTSSIRSGFQTWVDVEELSRPLEGAFRPGHFRGVATVCLKLFNIVRPRRAYFGQKDAQQVAVLRRMIRDLDLDLELRVAPDGARRRRPRALVPQRVPLAATSASARSRSPAPSPRATPHAHARCSRRAGARDRLRRRRSRPTGRACSPARSASARPV